MEVKIILNDYAIERTTSTYTLEDIKNDYRSTDLQLITRGDASVTTTLSVRQYNTITVDNAHHIGICRLDYGCHFDRETGEVVRPADAIIQWGYFSTGNLYVSGDNPMEYQDGESNTNKIYQRYINGKAGSGAWSGSIFQKIKADVISIVNGVAVSTGKIWYTPVYHEMWSIARTVNNISGENAYQIFGVLKNERYWCGTGDDLSLSKAYFIEIGTRNYLTNANKKDAYRVRSARHF